MSEFSMLDVVNNLPSSLLNQPSYARLRDTRVRAMDVKVAAGEDGIVDGNVVVAIDDCLSLALALVLPVGAALLRSA
jgi:hypothetical protein